RASAGVDPSVGIERRSNPTCRDCTTPQRPKCRVRLARVPTYALRSGSIRISGSTAGRTRRVEIETHRHGRNVGSGWRRSRPTRFVLAPGRYARLTSRRVEIETHHHGRHVWSGCARPDPRAL